MVGDLIMEVEGESTVAMGFYPSVNKIAGKENTVVNITVLRGGQLIPCDIIREVVDIPSVEFRMIGEDIGYISIAEFNSKTPDQLKEKMEKIIGISGVKGCIIDVRNNGGGDAGGVINSLDLFIDQGLIVSFVDKNGNKNEYPAHEGAYDIPVVILTNESTASAAELFAEAIRESANARIVGTTTYGKGVSQSVINLRDGTALVVTDTKYYTPNGQNYDGIGVVPDFEVIMPEEQLAHFYELTDSEDNQLSYGINLLKGTG
ncbi:putative CtpA-like serine protease [bioreactor metagenome]|uniref:Putative CtpA-like serine protease n=1 Tax=bioreactor metagenome TaxID=1076179 RepID=A0A645AI19_9ZZZZ